MTPDAIELIETITEAAAQKLPELAITGIDEALEATDDAILVALLKSVRVVLEEDGVEAAQGLADMLTRTIGGDLEARLDAIDALAAVGDVDGLQDIVDALQGAEAERVENATKVGRAIAAMLADLVRFAARSFLP